MKPATRIEMSRSPEFQDALVRGIQVLRPECVIETGTHIGTGSTRMILNAFDGCVPDAFFTLEVSRELVGRARENLRDVPQVQCIWGLSVRLSEAERFLQEDEVLATLDPALDIYVDFLPNPREGYLRELRGALGGDQNEAPPEGLLEVLLPRYRDRRPLICLDSAGGIGWLEFREVIRLQGPYPFMMVLDDTNHLKHHRSARYIRDSAEFTVVAENQAEGWIVALRN